MLEEDTLLNFRFFKLKILKGIINFKLGNVFKIRIFAEILKGRELLYEKYFSLY